MIAAVKFTCFPNSDKELYRYGLMAAVFSDSNEDILRLFKKLMYDYGAGNEVKNPAIKSEFPLFPYSQTLDQKRLLIDTEEGSVTVKTSSGQFWEKIDYSHLV